MTSITNTSNSINITTNNIIFEYTDSARYFDDSGWGEKNDTEYILQLYENATLKLIIRGLMF